MFSELLALSPEAIGLLEARRQSPTEGRLEILVRALSPQASELAPVDLGQGMIVQEGEPLVLVLSREHALKPMPKGEFRDGEFYMRGEKIVAKRGSVLQTAMQQFQEEVADVSANGGLVSRNAYRHWQVYRDGKLIPLERLQDPSLKNTRGGGATITLEDLGL